HVRPRRTTTMWWPRQTRICGRPRLLDGLASRTPSAVSTTRIAVCRFCLTDPSGEAFGNCNPRQSEHLAEGELLLIVWPIDSSGQYESVSLGVLHLNRVAANLGHSRTPPLEVAPSIDPVSNHPRPNAPFTQIEDAHPPHQ